MKKILIILIILISFTFFINESLISYEYKEEIIKEVIIEKNQYILSNVPFILQAPFGNWDNPIFQDACEEAAILMAKYWIQGKQITNEQAYNELIELSEFEEKNYSTFYDHSAKDTVEIMKQYINYKNIKVYNDIGLEDIKREIRNNNLVIVPVNGQAIKNPNYTLPGPERHMIVIIGYDETTKEIITNDSGTRMGKNYKYPESVFESAIRDYTTGYHEPIIGIQKNMIVVENVIK